jgi:hypothetical protein
MSDPRTARAQTFWQMNGLPRWEQIAFAAANLPFSLVTMILGFLLWLPFHIMILLVLPFMLFTLLGSVIWMVCLGIILGLRWLTERAPFFRPISFLLALPFMMLAHNLNGLTPAPTPGDLEAKVMKWDFIEAFPLTWSLVRFDP